MNNDIYKEPNGKLRQLMQTYGLSQLINEQTHFTENSSSLIDVILCPSNDYVLSSGVGDPFYQLLLAVIAQYL